MPKLGVSSRGTVLDAIRTYSCVFNEFQKTKSGQARWRGRAGGGQRTPGGVGGPLASG
jgi:hypothetical protein